jgi:hypothetical protein
MSKQSSHLLRGAALALVIGLSGVATNAYAFDAFGPDRESVILHAAQHSGSTAPVGTVETDKLGTQFGAGSYNGDSALPRDTVIRNAARSMAVGSVSPAQQGALLNQYGAGQYQAGA